MGRGEEAWDEGREEEGKTERGEGERHPAPRSVTGPASPPRLNDSDELKRGLWEVGTPAKPLAVPVLRSGCEQLPACQRLTEIIAVATGSFGRQMAEATPLHLPAAASRFSLRGGRMGRQTAASLAVQGP